MGEATTERDVARPCAVGDARCTSDACGGPEDARGAAEPTFGATRTKLLVHALRLEYLTVSWNVVEGVVAVAAAVGAGSVALLGFGIDSFVESASGLVMVWRLRAERYHLSDAARLDRVERRALRGVALSLFLLAGFVALDAARTLYAGDRPEFSLVGVCLTGISLIVMLWLARAKRRAAAGLGSRAMAADAFQTTACWWLSVAALIGVGLNGLAGWWWADPVAALAISVLIAKEGREAWAGERDCC